MPSNKDLITEALALDADAVTEGLNNVQLVALVRELRAEPAEAPQVVSIAKGKSITTKAGIKADGDIVTAAHFVGGAERLKELIAAGFCVVDK